MKRHGLILLVVLGAAPAAGAQPAIEVRTSFGATKYRQNDLEYAAPAVRVAVRAGSRRFAIEPELGFAWDSTTDTSHQFRNLGVNAIARARGRVAPFFGGGIGMYSERRGSTVNGQVGTRQSGHASARRSSSAWMSGPRHASVCSVRAASKRAPSATLAAAARFRDLPASPSRCTERRRVPAGASRASTSYGAAMSMDQCSSCQGPGPAPSTTSATVIPGAGTVYRAMENKGEWGFFDAPGGALVSNANQISLPAPVIVDAKTLKGDGWTAVLAPGWTVRPGPGQGSFLVVRQ